MRILSGFCKESFKGSIVVGEKLGEEGVVFDGEFRFICGLRGSCRFCYKGTLLRGHYKAYCKHCYQDTTGMRRFKVWVFSAWLPGSGELKSRLGLCIFPGDKQKQSRHHSPC